MINKIKPSIAIFDDKNSCCNCHILFLTNNVLNEDGNWIDCIYVMCVQNTNQMIDYLNISGFELIKTT